MAPGPGYRLEVVAPLGQPADDRQLEQVWRLMASRLRQAAVLIGPHGGACGPEVLGTRLDQARPV